MVNLRMRRGGAPVQGAELGIVAQDLKTGIAQPVGGIKNTRSYRHPVQIDFAPYGGLDLIAEKHDWVADAFVDTAERLAERGVQVAMGSCGMLGQYQSDVAARTSILVATSSLLQVPLVLRLLRPEQKVLVIGVDVDWSGGSTRRLRRAGGGPRPRPHPGGWRPSTPGQPARDDRRTTSASPRRS